MNARFVSEDIWIFLCLHAVRVIRPTRRNRSVATFFAQSTPSIPTAGKKPQTMHEHDRL
ncbi:MAG: hypothetical protein ABIQ44_08050 [Chloroflexia bacterium]